MRLFLSGLIALALMVPAAAVADEPDPIMAQVAETPNLQTLYALLDAAELDARFEEGGPHTLFAPSDKAFAKLPKATLRSLQQPENKEKLQRILMYHVAPNRITAAQAIKADGQSVKTLLEDRSAPIAVEGQTVQVGPANANVIQADINCQNGVIHIIDSVMMPPEQE